MVARTSYYRACVRDSSIPTAPRARSSRIPPSSSSCSRRARTGTTSRMFRNKQKHKGRLFAIGDIHGCPDELGAIVKAIAPCEDDTVVFVGDYVDRGPSARDAVEIVLDLQKGPAEVVALK